MIHIIGDGVIVQAQAFRDVQRALDFPFSLYLGAMWTSLLGTPLHGKVIYNMEPLQNSPLLQLGYLQTLSDNIVLDYSQDNIKFLASKGIEAFYLPYKYHKSQLRNPGIDCSKDIDVLFIGTTRFPRRLKILKKLSKLCNLYIADNLYGKELDSVMLRSKVHLNMHHTEMQPLEVVRLNYLIANNCCVVSEEGPDQGLNSIYSNWAVLTSYNLLVGRCLKTLNTFQLKDYNTGFKSYTQDLGPATDWVKNRSEEVF